VLAIHSLDEIGGVDLTSNDSKENLSQEVCGDHVSAEEPDLSPEMKDFIRRVIVPCLVDRYLEERKREATQRFQQSDVLTAPARQNTSSPHQVHAGSGRGEVTLKLTGEQPARVKGGS
jgi:hypothetical protein